MTKSIKRYIFTIDELLKSKESNINYENEIKNHLIHINFFQHERLIHLIVTVVFAILTIGIFLYTISLPSMPFFLLTAFFMILLIPYIKHYYLLENSVQYMYKQYDEMVRKLAK